MSAMTTPKDSQAALHQPPEEKPWYHKEIQDFSPACREILENYSNIPPAEIVPHIFKIRDKAWACNPYPCIGMFRFLEMSISAQRCYPRVLFLLKQTPTHRSRLLDLGCCFAQDIRKLVHDGAPSDSLYACDLKQDFLDLSFDLFRDKDSFKAHLFTADVLEEDDKGGPLDTMRGTFDVIYAASFIHLFNWDNQLKVCKRIIALLKPKKGSLVFGRQTGNLKGQEVPNPAAVENGRKTLWRHDVESFTRLWDLAGEETGTRWKTWAMLDVGWGMGSHTYFEEGLRRLSFEVERVE